MGSHLVVRDVQGDAAPVLVHPVPVRVVVGVPDLLAEITALDRRHQKSRSITSAIRSKDQPPSFSSATLTSVLGLRAGLGTSDAVTRVSGLEWVSPDHS